MGEHAAIDESLEKLDGIDADGGVIRRLSWTGLLWCEVVGVGEVRAAFVYEDEGGLLAAIEIGDEIRQAGDVWLDFLRVGLAVVVDEAAFAKAEVVVAFPDDGLVVVIDDALALLSRLWLLRDRSGQRGSHAWRSMTLLAAELLA